MGKWQEEPNQCPPGQATALPLFLLVNTSLFNITMWAIISHGKVKFDWASHTNPHAHTHYTNFYAQRHTYKYTRTLAQKHTLYLSLEEISRVRSKVMQMLQLENTGKTHSNYSISAHLHGIDFFLRRRRVYDQWSLGIGLFRNSLHFDLITKSKYSWNTMISPRSRRLAINFQIQVIY